MRIIIIISAILILLVSCEKMERPANTIIGTWNCNEHSDLLGQRTYQVSIIRNPSTLSKDNEYVINNFYNQGISESKEVYVTEDPKGTLKITGTSTLGISFSGTGVISADYKTIEWKYFVNDGVNNTYVSALYF